MWTLRTREIHSGSVWVENQRVTVRGHGTPNWHAQQTRTGTPSSPVTYHGCSCVLSAPVLTALSQRGRLLRDGLPTAPGCASPHVEFVLGGGVEVGQPPAGLGRGGDVDVVQLSDLLGVVY